MATALRLVSASGSRASLTVVIFGRAASIRRRWVRGWYDVEGQANDVDLPLERLVTSKIEFGGADLVAELLKETHGEPIFAIQSKFLLRYSPQGWIWGHKDEGGSG